MKKTNIDLYIQNTMTIFWDEAKSLKTTGIIVCSFVDFLPFEIESIEKK